MGTAPTAASDSVGYIVKRMAKASRLYQDVSSSKRSRIFKLLCAYGDLLVVLVVLGAAITVSCRSMPLPNVGFAQDLGVFLDAGWRFYQGQRCHADYTSGLGSVFAMLAGLPFKLLGPEYASLKMLPSAISAIVTIWAYSLIRGAVGKSETALASLAVGLYAGGIFHPGFEPEALTFAAFYNRVGFGLLSIVFLASLLRLPAESVLKNRWMEASVGAALILSLFLKVNYFVIGLVPVALSVLVRPRRIEYVVRVVVFAACTFIVLLPSIGFRVDKMMSDLWIATQIRGSVAGNLTFFPWRNFSQNLDYFCILVMQTACLVPTRQLKLSYHAIASVAILWLPTILGYGITLMQTHGAGRCFPTIVVGMVLSGAMLQASLAAGAGDVATRLRIFRIGTLLASALIVVPHLYAYVVLSKMRPTDFNGWFDGIPLRELRVGSANTWGEHFPAVTNEGMALVQSYCGSTDSLQYIDMANLFNFGLGIRSPKGSLLWWDDRATYSKTSFPSFESFKDTDFILISTTVPLCPQPSWGDIYGEWLLENYYEIGRSDNFVLFRRRAF